EPPRNIEEPVAELEVVAGETAQELNGPSLSEICFPDNVPIGNGPRCENSEHDKKAGEMGDSSELPHFSCAKENGQHDRIKEKQMERPFCEQAESQKNPRHRPREPRWAPLLPPAEPANQGE